MSAKRFRIAFSFAGEKRDFVATVAAILAKRFAEPAILYDKYHEAEFANWKLGLLLPELYRDQSDLIVVVVCSDYSRKNWCGLEWVAIHAMLMSGKDREIMLCRFEHAKLQGLNENAGYVELDDKTPEQAATLILERLAINEGEPKNHYTAEGTISSRHPSTTILNNLPRLQPFFGRTEELKQIAEALDPESRTWGALIDGAGGMGKTSLAVRAAYDCNPEQFKRIIFVSVKDREMDEDGVRTLGNLLVPGFLEMLNEIARELGQTDFAKAPEEQRIRLLLEALRPAQVLLILDNLESIPKSDRDQLFTFVRRLPHRCKAILTSRRRIGSGSELVQLDILDQDAALATLAELAGHNKLLARTSEAERLTLWKQTGGNPLLLRWVAGQLGRGSCRTLKDALAFLRSRPRNNDPLEFIFGDLANEFTADETKVLVALTYFTLPAKVEHIAEVAGLDEQPVATALRALANRSLVVPDQEENQYALVPMVADFLRKHRPEIVRETGNRLEQRAYALIVENGYQKHDRFPVLDDAWPTVVSALPLFLAGTNERLQRVCGALSRFLYSSGRWDEALALCTEAEPVALQAKDNKEAGWRAYQAAYIHFERKQITDFQAWAAKAYEHWSRPGVDPREKAAAVRLQGLAYLLQADYQAAKDAFEEALRQDTAINPKSRDVEKDLYDLAEAEKALGDTTAAEMHRAESRRIEGEWNKLLGQAFDAGHKSSSAIREENWNEAAAWAREALKFSLQCRRLDLEASNERRLAQALVRQGKAAEALPHARRAVEIYTKLGSPDRAAARAILEECASTQDSK